MPNDPLLEIEVRGKECPSLQRILSEELGEIDTAGVDSGSRLPTL